MLGSYPAWYWLCAWQLRPAGQAFAFLGVTLLLTLIAALHRKLDAPLGHRSMLAAAVLARVAAAGIGVGAFFLVQLFWARTGAAGAGVIFGLTYLIAWQLLRPVNTAESLLSVFSFIVLCTSWFLGMLFCFLQGGRRFDGVCWVMLAVTAAVYTVLRNFLMLRTAGGGRTELPRGFYGYNSLLIAGFLVPGALLLAFGRQIVGGVRFVLRMIGGYLSRLIRMLSVLILGTDWLNDDFEQLPAGQNDLLTRGLALVGLLVNAAVIGFALYFLIRYHRDLWDMFRGWLRDLLHTFRMLIRLREPELPPEEHEEYTDAVELLDAQRTKLKRRRNPPSWGRRYRQYKKLPAGAARFREGYALWLIAVQSLGAELSRTDTPKMQLEKSGGIPDKNATAALNEAYYRIRYGDQEPTQEECAAMDAVLQEIRKVK